MDQRPDPTPEGRLIAAAAKSKNLSIREAARRAGLSYGRWRQVTAGYQNVSPGEFAIVNAPALTVARMAAAVNLTPEQVETQGQRPDAAAIMRSDDIDLTAPDVPPDSALPPILQGLDPHELGPYLAAVERDLTDAAAGIRDPWKDAATDPVQQFELNILRSTAHDPDVKKVLLAVARMKAAPAPGQSRNRTRNTG
jgi:hypothetical protein